MYMYREYVLHIKCMYMYVELKKLSYSLVERHPADSAEQKLQLILAGKQAIAWLHWTNY